VNLKYALSRLVKFHHSVSTRPADHHNRLTDTKFGKAADLRVPTWLWIDLPVRLPFWPAGNSSRSTTPRNANISENIFLGRWGTALQPDSVYNRFKDALAAVALPGTFHDLRHTFAICTLDALMRSERYAGSKGLEALLVLKSRMRHEQILYDDIPSRS